MVIINAPTSIKNSCNPSAAGGELLLFVPSVQWQYARRSIGCSKTHLQELGFWTNDSIQSIKILSFSVTIGTIP
jgi:hypothetical protein